MVFLLLLFIKDFFSNSILLAVCIFHNHGEILAAKWLFA